jgi:hypothetical protein
MFVAASCAIRHDWPLLFTKPERQNAGRAEPPKPQPSRAIPVLDGDVPKACRSAHQLEIKGLSALAGSDLPPHFPRKVPTPTTLASGVVFAASKTPTDSPDVAVGLVLAAHLAHTGEKVSLVVVPRYLQADPQLESRLRNQSKLVKDGVLLGQAGILSADTQALLRQILRQQDRQGPLGAIQTNLGSLNTFVAALAALLALLFAAKQVPALKPAIVEGYERLMGPDNADNTPKERGRTVARGDGESGSKTLGELLEVRPEEKAGTQEVTVWLRSGLRVSGTVRYNGTNVVVATVSDVPGLTAFRLEGARVQDGTDHPEMEREGIALVPVSEVAMIWVAGGEAPEQNS